jgi:hypothetical protein
MAYSAPIRSSASAATGDLCAVKPSAHVRPAGRFLDASGLVDLLEARVAIGLQRSRELAQVRLRMLAFAVRRVGEPHRRGRCVSRRTIIANVGPQPSGFCFAVAWRQHPNRRVIGVQLVCAHHVATQRLHQRREQRAGSAYREAAQAQSSHPSQPQWQLSQEASALIFYAFYVFSTFADASDLPRTKGK